MTIPNTTISKTNSTLIFYIMEIIVKWIFLFLSIIAGSSTNKYNKCINY